MPQHPRGIRPLDTVAKKDFSEKSTARYESGFSYDTSAALS